MLALLLWLQVFVFYFCFKTPLGLKATNSDLKNPILIHLVWQLLLSCILLAICNFNTLFYGYSIRIYNEIFPHVLSFVPIILIIKVSYPIYNSRFSIHWFYPFLHNLCFKMNFRLENYYPELLGHFIRNYFISNLDIRIFKINLKESILANYFSVCFAHFSIACNNLSNGCWRFYNALMAWILLLFYHYQLPH
jgi:hypothetical protein